MMDRGGQQADSPSRNTGAHLVYAELKRQILSLELKPGARIYEPAMAEALRVSRTPLREAIRRLISESLLEQQPTGGVLVPDLDEAVISELYEVRAAMESLMARQACVKATAADIEALNGIFERNAAMVKFADEAMKQGMSLHAKIAEIAGNSALALRLAGNRVGQVVLPSAIGVVAAGLGAGGVFLASAVVVGGTLLLLRGVRLDD